MTYLAIWPRMCPIWPAPELITMVSPACNTVRVRSGDRGIITLAVSVARSECCNDRGPSL